MTRYGVWAGNPQGIPEDKTRCVESVYRNFRSYQCSRKRGHGKDGLYCKQYAKRISNEQTSPDTYGSAASAGSAIQSLQSIYRILGYGIKGCPTDGDYHRRSYVEAYEIAREVIGETK